MHACPAQAEHRHIARRPMPAVIRATLASACLVVLAACSSADDIGQQTRTDRDGSAASAPSEPGGGWKQLLPAEDECPGQDDAAAPTRQLRAAATCVIDHVRQQQGLDALPRSSTLHDTARGKLDDIVRCGEFSHTACGRKLSYWFDELGYLDGCRSGAYAENLGVGGGRLGAPRRIVLGWLQSQGHRKNLLSERWSEQAIAVERRGSWHGTTGASKRTYRDVNIWVSHFGVAHGC